MDITPVKRARQLTSRQISTTWLTGDTYARTPAPMPGHVPGARTRLPNPRGAAPTPAASPCPSGDGDGGRTRCPGIYFGLLLLAALLSCQVAQGRSPARCLGTWFFFFFFHFLIYFLIGFGHPIFIMSLLYQSFIRFSLKKLSSKLPMSILSSSSIRFNSFWIFSLLCLYYLYYLFGYMPLYFSVTIYDAII